jgi:hypothetical protein
MNGLTLHCGGQLKTREEVFSVPLPMATPTYMPLPHESFVTRIEKHLMVEGISIVEERLALAKEGNRLFGLLRVEIPGHTHGEYGCVIGLRNSYDKSCSTGICIGATVFVCDNLSFCGSQVTFQRKHTVNLMRDLTWIISETVNSLPAAFDEQSAVFQGYRSTPIDDMAAHDLIIQLVDRRALNVTEIPSVLREWRTPRHEQFCRDGKTKWRLFNAATETFKGDLWRLPYRTRLLREVLDAEPGRSAEFSLERMPDGETACVE